MSSLSRATRALMRVRVCACSPLRACTPTQLTASAHQSQPPRPHTHTHPQKKVEDVLNVTVKNKPDEPLSYLVGKA